MSAVKMLVQSARKGYRTDLPLRSLVAGSATASLRTFFTKLTTLQTKHSFHLVLALDLFSDLDNDSIELAELLAGKILVPVQIYATFGAGIIPDKVLDKFKAGEEICSNLTLLGELLRSIEGGFGSF